MKITNVKTIHANSFLYAQIETDEGICGVGESGAWGFLEASEEAIKSFAPYLIGKNPLDIEHHWQYMYRCYHFRGAAIMGAISAIDIALWDIAGKFYNAPVYQLLGGKCRDRVRTYYHVSGATTEEMVQGCIDAKKAGYTAVGHLSPFLDEPRSNVYNENYTHMINDAVDRVRQIRDAVGDDLDLCLELHRRMTPFEAVAFANKLEKYTPMFLEDPITPDNFDSMSYVANHTNVPIATGERIHTIQEYEMLFEKNAMAYARISVCLCGGITGSKKISSIAEAHGVKIVPHNPLSPVSTAACMQVAACVENLAIMELPDHEGIAATERYCSAQSVDIKAFKQSDLVDCLPKIEKGYAVLSERPGIGIELKPNIDKLFPAKRRDINTRLSIDGSVVDQ